MQNSGKFLKILIAVFVLLLCAAAIYFNLLTSKNAEKKVENADIAKDPAGELLSANKQAIQGVDSAKSDTVRALAESDYLLGDLSAPVQIIIYDDFDNLFSVEYYQTIKQVKEIFADKVVVSYRPFPMRSHANALNAALAAECAGEQGLFWEMAEKLYSASSTGLLDQENINLSAAALALDQVQFQECLTTQKYLEKIENSIAEAQAINILGVPTTYINNIPYPGAMPLEDFTDSADIARKGLKSIIEEITGA